MRFRLATWNINSVRLRLDLVSRLVKEERPDVLCLQEIKCVEGKFPGLELAALGFPHIAVSGQKGYHGVAILSRLPFTLLERRDICGRGHARHLSVKFGEANTTSMCRPAATSPTPWPTRSFATSSTSSKR
jgi:exodeoxyribonuclease-3